MGISKSMKLILSDISCKNPSYTTIYMINSWRQTSVKKKWSCQTIFHRLERCIFPQRVPLTRLPYLRVTRVRKAIEEDDRASGSKRCGLIQQLLFFCQSHSYHTYHMETHHHTIYQPLSGRKIDGKFQLYSCSLEEFPDWCCMSYHRWQDASWCCWFSCPWRTAGLWKPDKASNPQKPFQTNLRILLWSPDFSSHHQTHSWSLPAEGLVKLWWNMQFGKIGYISCCKTLVEHHSSLFSMSTYWYNHVSR